MLHLAVTLHVLGAKLADHAHAKLTAEPDRGSETIEKVLWAVAVIAIVGIVATVITNYVTAESGKIQ